MTAFTTGGGRPLKVTQLKCAIMLIAKWFVNLHEPVILVWSSHYPLTVGYPNNSSKNAGDNSSKNAGEPFIVRWFRILETDHIFKGTTWEPHGWIRNWSPCNSTSGAHSNQLRSWSSSWSKCIESDCYLLCSNFNHKHVRRHVLYFDVGRLLKIKDTMSTPESWAEKVPDTAKFSWPHLCPSMWEYHFEGSEWAKQVVDACVISLGLAHFFEWGLKTSILENLWTSDWIVEVVMADGISHANTYAPYACLNLRGTSFPTRLYRQETLKNVDLWTDPRQIPLGNASPSSHMKWPNLDCKSAVEKGN